MDLSFTTINVAAAYTHFFPPAPTQMPFWAVFCFVAWLLKFQTCSFADTNTHFTVYNITSSAAGISASGSPRLNVSQVFLPSGSSSYDPYSNSPDRTPASSCRSVWSSGPKKLALLHDNQHLLLQYYRGDSHRWTCLYDHPDVSLHDRHRECHTLAITTLDMPWL